MADDSVETEFRQFVAARSAALLRTAYLLVGDWAHAEDVLQTSLTKTYLAWRRLAQQCKCRAHGTFPPVGTAIPGYAAPGRASLFRRY